MPQLPLSAASADWAVGARSLAHALRNPLSAVQITLQSFERMPLAPRDQRRVQIALRELAQVDRLLDGLVRWAAPDDPRGCSDPLEVTRRAIDLARQDHPAVSIGLLSYPSTDLRHRVLSAPGPLLHALGDLLDNACHHAPPATDVRVTVDVVADPESKRPMVLWQVRDRGAGLDQRLGARVGQPFVTRSSRRLGLGLARVGDLARRLGGWLKFDSPAGGGTNVGLWIPLDCTGTDPTEQVVPEDPCARR